MELLLFYVFAAVLLFAATMVITAKNPVHSALFLVLAFFNSAALWLMAEAEFLGIALVLIYVGAVMVLFLFVVMMLDINLVSMREGFARYLPIGALVGCVMVVEMALVVGSQDVNLIHGVSAAEGVGMSNTKALGSVLYTVYAYPFEIASVVLLVAIVAAIMLTHRRRPDTKHQNIDRQVRVRKEQRLRIVTMAPEKRK
ncbi:MAG: NADH-quinone oxidoreductase subunit J [Nitrococcus mobilis]|nr:NADH-quinone oxidoreductase subunit J [Nitrococcus mobilis]